jgi:hypothetical protein
MQSYSLFLNFVIDLRNCTFEIPNITAGGNFEKEGVSHVIKSELVWQIPNPRALAQKFRTLFLDHWVLISDYINLNLIRALECHDYLLVCNNGLFIISVLC